MVRWLSKALLGLAPEATLSKGTDEKCGCLCHAILGGHGELFLKTLPGAFGIHTGFKGAGIDAEIGRKHYQEGAFVCFRLEHPVAVCVVPIEVSGANGRPCLKALARA
jgi:hypothetical protein